MPLQTNLSRRAFAGLLLAALGDRALAATPSATSRDPLAEQFVQQQAQRLIRVLADQGQSLEQKQASFHRAIDALADVPRITGFVLGRYARTITPDQRARFAQAFRLYAEQVYRSRLDDYGGEALRVTGSTIRKPGDVVVDTAISGGGLGAPVMVSWRVLGGGPSWKVVDVQFRGVWLAITQQQDFVSTIDNAGGDIDVLIAQLQQAVRSPPPRKP
jgi:phospholipid transport system substrate-binding protein